MNKKIALIMKPVIAEAQRLLATSTMKAAKAFIKESIDANRTSALDTTMLCSFHGALTQRTKADFGECLRKLAAYNVYFLEEEEIKEKAESTITRIKEETGVSYEIADVIAVIKTLPFFSYSGVLQELAKLKKDSFEVDSSNLDNFSIYHYKTCVKAGASRREADTLVRRFGDKALTHYLDSLTIKHGRFNYYKAIQKPGLTAEDRIFIENCLLSVAKRLTTNQAILDLFEDIDTREFIEPIPDGVKRRLLDWALNF